MCSERNILQVIIQIFTYVQSSVVIEFKEAARSISLARSGNIFTLFSAPKPQQDKMLNPKERKPMIFSFMFSFKYSDVEIYVEFVRSKCIRVFQFDTFSK